MAYAGALALIDLVLILLVARKLRALSDRVPRASGAPWLPRGAQAGDFTATATDGSQVSSRDLRGQPLLIGLFSTSCEPCRRQVPAFAELVSGPAAPARSLALVVGPDDISGYARQLEAVTTVIHEIERGPVCVALSARAFPVIYLIAPDGRVIASGPSVESIPALTPVP